MASLRPERERARSRADSPVPPPGLPSVRRLTARFAASLSSLAGEEELHSITARNPTTRWRVELSRARPALTDSILRHTRTPAPSISLDYV